MIGEHSAGKGSTRRPQKLDVYRANYDSINWGMRCEECGSRTCSGDPKYCPVIEVMPIRDGKGTVHYFHFKSDRFIKNIDGYRVGKITNSLGWFQYAVLERAGLPVHHFS